MSNIVAMLEWGSASLDPGSHQCKICTINMRQRQQKESQYCLSLPHSHQHENCSCSTGLEYTKARVGTVALFAAAEEETVGFSELDSCA